MTRFLNAIEVQEIQNYQIRNFGGDYGLRDKTLLESAIGGIQLTFGGQYLYPDIYSQAAAYLFHLVKNHPFVDGNKRAGAMTAVVFLELNGYHFNAPPDTFANLVIDVASGKSEKEELIEFFKKYTH